MQRNGVPPATLDPIFGTQGSAGIPDTGNGGWEEEPGLAQGRGNHTEARVRAPYLTSGHSAALGGARTTQGRRGTSSGEPTPRPRPNLVQIPGKMPTCVPRTVSPLPHPCLPPFAPRNPFFGPTRPQAPALGAPLPRQDAFLEPPSITLSAPLGFPGPGLPRGAECPVLRAGLPEGQKGESQGFLSG